MVYIYDIHIYMVYIYTVKRLFNSSASLFNSSLHKYTYQTSKKDKSIFKFS